jgi:predicted RNase H-like nuclease (RuvC/YqgF family)
MSSPEEKIITELALVKRDVQNLEKLSEKIDDISKEINELSKLLAIQHRIIENHETRINSLFVSSRTDTEEEYQYRAGLNRQFQEIRDGRFTNLREIEQKFTRKIETFDQKIQELEKWKWWVMGAGAVIASFVSYMWKSVFPM